MRPHKASLSRNRRKTDTDFGSAYRVGKSLFRQTRIVAHELTGAIHDHLWRIDRSEAESLAVSGLAIGEQARRVRILPPQLIPIIYVLAWDNDIRSGDRLVVIKLLEYAIGRRTTSSPF